MKKQKLTNKLKVSFKNEKQYNIFKSKQLWGLLLTILAAYLLVVSMMQVSGFTTLYSYTFGFLLGYYSYFILFALLFVGLSTLFNLDIHIERFLARRYNRTFNLSWGAYLCLVFGIALVAESAVAISLEGKLFAGTKSFELAVLTWWKDFTGVHNPNPSLPDVWNSGLLPALVLALISSWSGYVFSILCGLLLVLYFGFYLYFGSIIGILRTAQTQKKHHWIKGEDLKEHETKILDLTFENDNVIDSKIDAELIDTKKTVTMAIANADTFFDADPVSTADSAATAETKFLETKTQEYNQHHELIKPFDIEQSLTVDQRLLDPDTFEFELDIFDTITVPITDEHLETSTKTEASNFNLPKESH